MTAENVGQLVVHVSPRRWVRWVMAAVCFALHQAARIGVRPAHAAAIANAAAWLIARHGVVTRVAGTRRRGLLARLVRPRRRYCGLQASAKSGRA